MQDKVNQLSNSNVLIQKSYSHPWFDQLDTSRIAICGFGKTKYTRDDNITNN